MHVLRRLVWWKGLFWAAVGCGCGAAVVAYWPEPGPPRGATRVSVERLAVTLAAGPASGDGIAKPVVFPEHEGVRLLTFDLLEPGHSTPAYAYLNEPFLTESRLGEAVEAGRPRVYHILRAVRGGKPIQQAITYQPTDPNSPYAGRLGDAADRALADLGHRPGHVVPSFAEYVAHVPGAPVVRRAWWAEGWWRTRMPIWAGAVSAGLLGTWLTRRSEADVRAADLLRQARPAAAPAAVPVDMSKVEALDALLVERLKAGVTAAEPAPAASEPAPAAPVVLHAEAVEAAARAEAEAKAYAGEFYPTVRPTQAPRAFSLVELMVSIGVIGILVALLLPAVIGSRQSADTIACAANLHAIGQGMAIYLGDNRNTFPPAYLYIGHSIVNGVQTPTTPAAGYVHWSSYLYGSGSVPAKAFQCPAMRAGGLPPTNTPPGNRDPGQVCPGVGVVDQQVPRLAYTVNEVLCPRNKFVMPPFAGSRVYRFVKANEVARSAETILATEMIDNDFAVSYDDQGTNWVMSHRPICGYFGVDGTLDMFKVPVGAGFRQTTTADLDADPATEGTSSRTRLDLVGRNHGTKRGYPDRRRSNFLYVDGHVRTQTIYDTVSPFQWGDRFYSLTPNGDQVGP